MRIEIDKEEYKDLIETKVEFLKTVRKLDNITIENIKLTDKLQEKEQECEKLKEAIDSLLKIQYQLADSCTKYEQTLTKIKEIVEGMHDLWINKTPYTDMDNFVKHLLECELNRIRYKLDEISECEV